MGSRIRYREGDLFAVPLDDGGYAAGLAARSNQQGVVLGYFFGRRFADLPEVDQFAELTSEDAVVVERFGDLGLIQESWPVLGQMPGWRRGDWPMPAFSRAELLTGRLLRVEYSDDDPNSLLREVEVASSEFEQLAEDGLAGFEFMQERLSRLLPVSR